MQFIYGGLAWNHSAVVEMLDAGPVVLREIAGLFLFNQRLSARSNLGQGYGVSSSGISTGSGGKGSGVSVEERESMVSVALQLLTGEWGHNDSTAITNTTVNAHNINSNNSPPPSAYTHVTPIKAPKPATSFTGTDSHYPTPRLPHIQESETGTGPVPMTGPGTIISGSGHDSLAAIYETEQYLYCILYASEDLFTHTQVPNKHILITCLKQYRRILYTSQWKRREYSSATPITIDRPKNKVC